MGSETVAYIGAEGDGTTNLPGKIYSAENSATKNWWLGIDPNTEVYLKTQWLNQTGELVVYNNPIVQSNN